MRAMGVDELVRATLKLLSQEGIDVESRFADEMITVNSLPLQVNEDTARAMRIWGITFTNNELRLESLPEDGFSRLDTGDNVAIKFEASDPRGDTIYIYTTERDGKVMRYSINRGVFDASSETDVTKR